MWTLLLSLVFLPPGLAETDPLLTQERDIPGFATEADCIAARDAWIEQPDARVIAGPGWYAYITVCAPRDPLTV